MTSNELRSSFLKYFASQDHRVVQSSPLIPSDDPTLLFTNAGMNQFKDVFLGREKRDYTRAATSQKVMRVSGKHNDLDNVGPSLRHHTFFEMLGNFSFGDYFKETAIELAWTLLTEVWKMPAERLVVSIFKGEQGIPRDSEAYDIWRKFVPGTRILELGTDDNFWQMGDTGPCGRCSEIYYVRGTGSDPEIEIWNNVFMEFERSAGGTLHPLPAPSIDTGMGLERLTSVMQQKESNYDTDVFAPLITGIGELADVKYGADNEADISMRVVADHMRATTFLIADGVIPSNEWRGYVLRKIMRRAMRHGKHLGLTEPFLHRLVGVLDRQMGDAYPEVRSHRASIEKSVLAEEKRFDAVLTDGLPRLEAEIATALEAPPRTLAGDVAFRLYDTFGIPYDFIEDTAATRDVRVDKAAFDRAMEAQRGKGRSQGAFGARKDAPFQLDERSEPLEVGDQFEGYSSTRITGVPIVALWNEDRRAAAELAEGQRGYVALGKTPFYLEAGGQVSDTGRIFNASGEGSAIVEGVAKTGPGTPRAHHVVVDAGALKVRDLVNAEVDPAIRDATRRNHTATHLLHAALRHVFGSHVSQKGSLVAPDRLRFDFVHFQAPTRAELDRIEQIVNEQILKNTVVETTLRPTTEAIASGAMALFGEKYGDVVRVVNIPGFSMELCGGTHVAATGEIGLFVIVAESGIAAGVRRVEALTGLGAMTWAQQQRAALDGITAALNASADHALDAIDRLKSDNKRLTSRVEQLTLQHAERVTVKRHEFEGFTLLTQATNGLSREQLRALTDKLKETLRSGIVLTATVYESKPSFVISITKDLTDRYKAGELVKTLAPIIGGGGGGRADFAEAGGKLEGKIDELLESATAWIQTNEQSRNRTRGGQP